jgi:hypothetical protein
MPNIPMRTKNQPSFEYKPDFYEEDEVSGFIENLNKLELEWGEPRELTPEEVAALKEEETRIEEGEGWYDLPQDPPANNESDASLLTFTLFPVSAIIDDFLSLITTKSA